MENTLIAICILLTCFYRLSYALNVDTHYELNKAIAEKNILEFSLNTCLIDQLGFKKGINEDIKEYFTIQKVFMWLGEGGEKEDDPLGSR